MGVHTPFQAILIQAILSKGFDYCWMKTSSKTTKLSKISIGFIDVGGSS